jgi:aspartate/tyrosine/aromatic aminotransferase
LSLASPSIHTITNNHGFDIDDGNLPYYLHHPGINDYVKLALEFAYGADSPALKEKRVAGVQTISGTGACRLAGDFYARFLGKGSPLYLPNPTWCVVLDR